MLRKTKTLLTAAISALFIAAPFAAADMGRPSHQGGFVPWQSSAFAALPYYSAPSAPAPQQSQAQVYDIAPAAGQAGYANAVYDNRWADLQVMLSWSRKDFQISTDYLAAQQQATDAQKNYDDAVEVVLSRLANDQQYHDLVLKRTETQVALKATPIGTGIRNSVATTKLEYSTRVSQIEANALENDSAVQDTRAKLVAASQNLKMKELQFESQLYHDPNVTAAKQQMEEARAMKAGADAYLNGALVTRNDQLGINNQSAPGNNVFMTPWPGYGY